MMNQLSMDNVVDTQESESENELVSISGQLESELVTQIPSVGVENSSDIHIGPHLQYKDAVANKQYITVKGKDDNGSLAETPSKYTETDTVHPPERAIPVDAGLIHPSKDVLAFQKPAWLRNRYVWSSLVIVLVAAIVTAPVVALSESQSKSIPTDKIQFQYDNEDVHVYEGHSSVQWVVNVTASSEPKLVWYGPNCTELGKPDGPSRYEINTLPTGAGTKLNISNITLQDKGLYRLQAINKDGEEWAYFTLNVEGKNPSARQHVVVCYIAAWAHSRRGLGHFTVDNIDPALCTHLVYAFANLDITRNAIQSRTPEYDLEENDGTTGAYRKMTSLKEDYPHLKVLLAMGGWAERMDKNYSVVAESPTRRKAFISSVSNFLRKYKFDGLDLHWQYPAEHHGVPADKENFVSLLKELREEFDKFGWLLTAPLGVMPDTLDHSYNIPAVSQHLHYMFALCYAYHGSWESQTGANAPLYSIHDNLSVVSTIQTLLRMGADRKKLVLGLPLYGRIFKLRSTEGNAGFQKETVGAGNKGPYLQEPGFWGYNEICMEVDDPAYNWKKYWDNDTHTPYASKDDQFMTYDDARSLTEKVELAVNEKLAGVVVWSLDTDDFRGKCTNGKSGSTRYPLLRAVKNAFDNPLENVPCTQRSSTSGSVNLGPTSAVIALMLWKNILCLY